MQENKQRSKGVIFRLLMEEVNLDLNLSPDPETVALELVEEKMVVKKSVGREGSFYDCYICMDLSKDRSSRH